MNVKKLKSLIKKNVGEKPTFGTNPRDPWSAKYDINEDLLSETPLLNRYLKSRGINPEFATKDQKVAHSKTMQFKKWMNDHMNDPVSESMTTEPTITHKKSNALKTSSNKQKEIKTPHGPGSQFEEVEPIDEISRDLTHSYFKKAHAQVYGAEKGNTPKDVRKKRAVGMNKATNRLRNILTIPKDAKTGHSTTKPGQYIGDSVELEGICAECNEDPCSCSHGFVEGNLAEGLPQTLRKVVPGYAKREIDKKMDAGKFGKTDADKDANFQRYKKIQDKLKKQGVAEAKEADYGGDYQSAVKAVKAKAEKKPVDMKSLAARMQASYRRDNEKSKVKSVPAMKESQLEPMAACNQPWDGANSPDDTIKAKRDVKMIKGLAKKKSIKEDLYDHEKEDKSVSGPAKKPKMEKLGMDSTTKLTPQAAAVLKGGKTLTGEPRDTIEIDPMMAMRKQAGNSQNAENEKNSQKNN